MDKSNVLPNREFWTPRQIMKLFGIGRTLAYDMISQCEFGTPIRVGGLRVRRAGIVEFIERKEAEMAEELDSRLA